MILEFEIDKTFSEGEMPDMIDFPNKKGQLFYIKDGKLFAKASEEIINGKWEDVELEEELDVSPDGNISFFSLSSLTGFGAYGTYRSGSTHKLIIYEYAKEYQEYLNNGNISHNGDSPISSLTLTLENPLSKNPEKPGNVISSEDHSRISPGAKVEVIFQMGEEEVGLGVFYADRTDFKVGQDTVQIEARNTIGKILRDQTLDEFANYVEEGGSVPIKNLHLIVEELLENAGLDKNQYFVESSSLKYGLSFPPNMTFLQAIEEIIKLEDDWVIGELRDGTIVVGSMTYPMFETGTIHDLQGEDTAISRQVVRDDIDSFRRVIVHTPGFKEQATKDVKGYEGWSLKANKTFYVEMPENTKLAQLQNRANVVSKGLKDAGKTETLELTIRPHWSPDDKVVTFNGDDIVLSTVTEVSHSFGKSGYTTTLVADTSPRIKGRRLSSYIDKITAEKRKPKTKIFYS